MDQFNCDKYIALVSVVLSLAAVGHYARFKLSNDSDQMLYIFIAQSTIAVVLFIINLIYWAATQIYNRRVVNASK